MAKKPPLKRKLAAVKEETPAADDSFFSLTQLTKDFKLSDDEMVQISSTVLEFTDDEYSLKTLIQEKKDILKGLLTTEGALVLILQDLGLKLADLEGKFVYEARELAKFKNAQPIPIEEEIPQKKEKKFIKPQEIKLKIKAYQEEHPKENLIKRKVISRKTPLEPKFQILSIKPNLIQTIHFTPLEDQSGLEKLAVDYDHIDICITCEQERLLHENSCPVCDGVMTEQEYIEQMDIAFDVNGNLEDTRVLTVLRWLYDFMSKEDDYIPTEKDVGIIKGIKEMVGR